MKKNFRVVRFGLECEKSGKLFCDEDFENLWHFKRVGKFREYEIRKLKVDRENSWKFFFDVYQIFWVNFWTQTNFQDEEFNIGWETNNSEYYSWT